MAKSSKPLKPNYVDLSPIFTAAPEFKCFSDCAIHFSRYPRPEIILIFESIEHLSIVNGLIQEMGKKLEKTGKNVPEKKWNATTGILRKIIEPLKKAYVEYERCWQPSDWQGADDPNYLNGFEDSTEMSWRMHDLRASFYDRPSNGPRIAGERPRCTTFAEVACAEALCSAYFILNAKIYDDMVEEQVRQLQQHLYNYHAASLQIVVDSQVPLSRGRITGAFGALHKLLEELIGLHGFVDIGTLWLFLKEEIEHRSVLNPLIVEAVDDEREVITFQIGNKQTRATRKSIQNALSRVYAQNNYEPDRYLKVLFLEKRPATFSSFWLRLKAECERPAYENFKTTKMISTQNDELQYQYGDEIYCVAKSVIQHRFAAFRKIFSKEE